MPARSPRRCAPPGLRVETDLRNEKINYKVREHSLAHVPYLLVVGKREAEERTVALRPLGADARQEVIGLDALVERLRGRGAAARPARLIGLRGDRAHSRRDKVAALAARRIFHSRRCIRLGGALLHRHQEKPTYVPPSTGAPPPRRSTAPASTNSSPCPRCA